MNSKYSNVCITKNTFEMMVMPGNRSTVVKRLCVAALAAQVLAGGSTYATSSEMSPMQCGQPLAQRLTQAAIASLGAVQQDGSLYGMQRWTVATRASYVGLQFPGLLSCAYTVSAIFRAACHPIGNLASVSAIDTALSRWPKIVKIEDLKPIVLYISSSPGCRGRKEAFTFNEIAQRL
ncbi:hypothetical protein [Burkholderia sp. BE17]|uniref:hypothetical protein n=1 Tax=Burkholderia sp. BE17 TaxID=2656644 RepID=UPI00128E602D|nr:hypothetical protein [Burkholderia sp. BE17]MPV71375.1 hypothetical protein [Burkholderia sp. BE17]